MNKRKEQYIKEYNDAIKKIALNKPETVKDKISMMLDITKKIPTKLKYETFEICLHLGTDPKKTDQNIKTSVALPHGWKSNKKIGLFVTNDIKLQDYPNITVGGLKLIEEIKDKKEHNFNVCVAQMSLEKNMNSIAKYLTKSSPNKKYGTLTDNAEKVAKNISDNKLLLISNEKNMLHTAIGTSQMTCDQILENIYELISTVNNNKPAKLNTAMIKSIRITTTQAHKAIIITPRELALSKQ